MLIFANDGTENGTLLTLVAKIGQVDIYSNEINGIPDLLILRIRYGS